MLSRPHGRGRSGQSYTRSMVALSRKAAVVATLAVVLLWRIARAREAQRSIDSIGSERTRFEQWDAARAGR
jgi:hypothetical protein